MAWWPLGALHHRIWSAVQRGTGVTDGCQWAIMGRDTRRGIADHFGTGSLPTQDHPRLHNENRTSRFEREITFSIVHGAAVDRLEPDARRVRSSAQSGWRALSLLCERAGREKVVCADARGRPRWQSHAQ